MKLLGDDHDRGLHTHQQIEVCIQLFLNNNYNLTSYIKCCEAQEQYERCSQ